MASDTEKQDQIAEAALEVFLRYGFKKATMGDIADKAGMSRPSVYLVYSNKEDIFRAVITRKVEEFTRETEEKLATGPSVRDGLKAVLDTWVLTPFEMIITSPESEELMEFAYSFAPDLRKQMLKTMEEQLLQAISSDSKAKSQNAHRSKLSNRLIARLIAVSTAEMKHDVSDIEELRKLIDATVEIHASYLSAQ